MRSIILLLAVLFALPVIADDSPAAPPSETPATEDGGGASDLNEKEAAFQQMLTGVKMTGAFTIVGREMKGAPKEESYQIERLAKITGDNWLIMANAKWGKNDVTLPFPVRVVWADDTPVITLTDVGFPGLGGKFSCRVLFREGRYAGTWKHDAVGGHMFGTFEKIAAEKVAPTEEAPTEEAPTKEPADESAENNGR